MGPNIFSPSVSRSLSDDTFVLEAGWVLDGTGSPVQEALFIGVHKGMIVSLGDTWPSWLQRHDVMDLSGSTVMPGLVDCHVHLFMSGAEEAAVRSRQLAFTFPEARPVIEAHLRQHLRHGVVAVRDGGDYGGHALRYRNEVLSGAGVPVHVRCAGRAWRASGRYGTLIGRPPANGRTLAESIALRDENTDHVKIVNSGLNSLRVFARETPPQFSLEELTEAAGAAKTLGLRTMVHANGRLPVTIAVKAQCDSVEHGYFMGGDALAMMAEHRIFWVPTAFTMQAYAECAAAGSVERSVAERNLNAQLAQLARARAESVAVAVGTDCGSLGVHHGSSFARELGLLIEAGFSAEEAVRCATLNGATLLGLDKELGRLDVGMPATFVVIKGSPRTLAEGLQSVQRVYVRGERVV
jgi:imidazolonepropionase-like amidohydrolase